MSEMSSKEPLHFVYNLDVHTQSLPIVIIRVPLGDSTSPLFQHARRVLAQARLKSTERTLLEKFRCPHVRQRKIRFYSTYLQRCPAAQRLSLGCAGRRRTRANCLVVLPLCPCPAHRIVLHAGTFLLRERIQVGRCHPRRGGNLGVLRRNDEFGIEMGD